jgi:hypothetical protein
LTVPEGWRAWHDAECATLVGPGDIGALQISAAFKETDVLETDLLDLASEHLDAGAKPAAIHAGDFVGFELAFSDGDTYWRHWYLRNGSQMLFITYNCELGSRGIEDGSIRETVESLMVKGRDLQGG